MRSFAKTWRNHQWFLWRHLTDVQFFCATHDDPQFESVKNFPEGTIISKLTQPEMVAPAGCPKEWTQGQHYMHEPYAISVSPQAVLGQIWNLRAAWDLVQKSGREYGLVIRVRPDLWFHELTLPEFPVGPSTAWTPWWGRFGGINDRFAVMGWLAAERYFTTWDRVPDLVKDGAPLHPETLMKLSLGACFQKPNLDAVFSTVRVTGDFRMPEILPTDIVRHSAYLSYPSQ